MHATKLIPSALVFLLAASLPAQTNSWIGQPSITPGRVSSWHDPAYWSAGVVPDGPDYAAQIHPKYLFSPAGAYVGNETILVANDAITLYSLTFGQPGAYYSHDLAFPQVQIGGGGGARGVLELAGSGISVSTYPPTPVSFRLDGGQLIFSAHAGVNSPVTAIDVVTVGSGNQVWLRDDSSAGRIRLWLEAGSRLDAGDRASLGNSSARVLGGEVSFADESTLNAVGFSIEGPSFLQFGDRSNVQFSTFNFNRAGPGVDSIVRFSGQTTVMGGHAASSRDAGVIEFTDQAQASSFNLYGVRQLDVTGAATGTGTTGRVRATTGTPAPNSVAADDARTIDLGHVTVTDLLLGSNSVRVQGGTLGYVSDVGGAYLAADGSNLRGGGVIMGGPYGLWLRPTHAAAPYALPLTIETGFVYTDRQQLGTVQVQPAGTLSLGTGASGSILNSGRVQLNASSYTVRGDYTQTAGGTLVLYPSGPSLPPARLVVEGDATLDGQLTGSISSGYFVGSFRHPVLTAGSLSGAFASAPAVQLSPMLSIGTEYTDREVRLVFKQNPFLHAGATASQQALGNHLDATLGAASGGYYSLLYRLNSIQDPAQVAAGLGQLAPDRYGVLNELHFMQALALQAQLDRRLAADRQAPTGGISLAAGGGRLTSRFDAIDGLPEVEFETDGASAAAAWRRGSWTVGASVARHKSRADLDGLGSTARLESTAPGVFAQYTAGRFFAHGAATRSSDRYELRRNSGVQFRPSLVSAGTRGSRTDLSLTGGFTWRGKSWTVTPFAGVLASHVRLDDFGETLSAGAAGSELSFRNWSIGSIRIRGGLDVAWSLAQGRLRPRLSVGWLQELEKERAFPAGLAASGVFYRAPGRRAETRLLQGGLGLDWHLSPRLGFSLDASAGDGRNSAIVADLSAGFRWQF